MGAVTLLAVSIVRESVPIAIMAHEARVADVRSALAAIDALDIIAEKTNLIRVEDNLE